MNAQAVTTPNAGMPCPSTPPRELKIALGYGLTLSCYATDLQANGRVSLSVSLSHSQLRVGHLGVKSIVWALLDRHDPARLRIDTDSLWIGSTSFELGSAANADAVAAWAAAHGVTIRRTEWEKD